MRGWLTGLRRRRPGGADALVCQEFVEVVTDYLEGRMSPQRAARLEAHLTRCDGCTAYLDQMRQTVRLMGRLTVQAVPTDGRDRLLDAFRAWKADRT